MILLALVGCGEDVVAPEFPVRAVLEDGQVLVGAVETESLRLETGFGLVDVPLADVGIVLPVEGGGLADSGDHVNVWLRNGTEIRGRWSEPELAMVLEVGDQAVPVDLPTATLEKFQLQGGDMMPSDTVYRVATVYGDDLLVDADRTRFAFENELGSFAPFLRECVRIEPIEGDPFAGEPDLWRVTLVGGTVLIGAPADDALNLALPVGPDEIGLSLSEVVSFERQDWSGWGNYRDQTAAETAASQQDLNANQQHRLEDLGYVQRPAPAARSMDRHYEGAGAADTGWFDNRAQSGFKSLY